MFVCHVFHGAVYVPAMSTLFGMSNCEMPVFSSSRFPDSSRPNLKFDAAVLLVMSCTEYEWPWYESLVGAWFLSHPPGLQTTRLTFADDGIAQDGRTWQVTDELYNYRSNPRERARDVATVDESGYSGGTMGADHPIAWCHAAGKGHSWYTGLGHRNEIYADETFRRHLLRGLHYAAGDSDDC